MRFAVSVVTWRQAEMRWPASGGSRPNRREHRHLPVGPLDPPLALLREGEVLYVVPLRSCHLFLSLCGEKSFVLALLPFHPGRVFDVGEPTVDRGAELGLPSQTRGEGEIADPEAEAAPQLCERAELVQLAQAVEPVAGGRARREDEPGLLERAEQA